MDEPIEVLVFAHLTTARALTKFGEPVLRLKDGVPVTTDSGNFIYDVTVQPFADPEPIDQAFRQVPGVVETGLFCGRADWVIVAESQTIRRLSRGS